MIRGSFLAGIIALLFLAGCTTTKYVPVETVRTEYVEADTTAIYNRAIRLFESVMNRDVRSDSLVDHRKETVVINEKGDTTRHISERIVYRSSNREMELEHRVSEQDSIIDVLRLRLTSVKADSISVPYPVERDLTKWETVKMDLGGIAIGVFAIVICVAVIWLIRRFNG